MRINSPLIIRFVNLYGPDDTILAKLVQLSPNCSIICAILLPKQPEINYSSLTKANKYENYSRNFITR